MGRHHLGIIIFCSVWLIVLNVPSLRVMLQLQVRQGGQSRPVYDRWGGRDADAVRRLAARYPNDVRVLAKRIEWDQTLYEQPIPTPTPAKDLPVRMDSLVAPSYHVLKTKLRLHDELIQRFPKVPWLIANRLRITTSGRPSDRRAGELDAPPAGTPEQPKWPPIYSPQELEQAVAIARQGSRLEPDNSFYDWMLVSFLLGLNRDGEAFKALHDGSLKSHYDDHTQSDVQVGVAVRELERPLLVEEKVEIAAGQLFPHLGVFYHTGRIVVWEGIKAARSGNHQRALQIYGDLARLGSIMRRDSNAFVGSRAAIGFTTIVWRNQQQPAKYDYSPQAVLSLSRQFAAYAAAHGRRDLAAEATRAGEEAAAYLRTQQRPNSLQNFFFSLSSGSFSGANLRHILSLWWIGVALLPQLVLLAVLWIFLSFLTRRTTSNHETISWTDVASTLIVGCCVTGGLILAACLMGAGWSDWESYDANPSQSWIDFLRRFIVAAPATVATIYCLCAMWWRNRKSLRASLRPNQDGPTAQGRGDIKPLLKWTANWLLSIGTVYAWLSLLMAYPDLGTTGIIAIALLLTCGCLLRATIKWLPATRTQLRPMINYGLRWYRQTVGACLVVSSVAYLLLLLLSLPVATLSRCHH